ncbi:hypothetical protein BC835DRAFT_1309890 [Cytidiella melzeri]|nr:hypothetical protein BC835DRAFT_1309890 [Cytidiella melzeri]
MFSLPKSFPLTALLNVLFFCRLHVFTSECFTIRVLHDSTLAMHRWCDLHSLHRWQPNGVSGDWYIVYAAASGNVYMTYQMATGITGHPPSPPGSNNQEHGLDDHPSASHHGRTTAVLNESYVAERLLVD